MWNQNCIHVLMIIFTSILIRFHCRCHKWYRPLSLETETDPILNSTSIIDCYGSPINWCAYLRSCTPKIMPYQHLIQCSAFITWTIFFKIPMARPMEWLLVLSNQCFCLSLRLRLRLRLRQVYSTQHDIIQMHDIRHTWQFLCIIQN